MEGEIAIHISDFSSREGPHYRDEHSTPEEQKNYSIPNIVPPYPLIAIGEPHGCTGRDYKALRSLSRRQ